VTASRPRSLPRVGIALRAGSNGTILDANIAFHLRAGTYAIAVWAPGDTSREVDILEGLELDAQVHRVPRATPIGEIATWAARELAVDWLIQTDSTEFWWPRGASIPDVVSTVSAGCNAAQGVTRALLPAVGGQALDEVFTMRLSPRASSINQPWRPSRRFAVRSSSLGVDPSELDPLWGYYAFEVLVLTPSGSGERDAAAFHRAQELDVLVPDMRLSGALREIRADHDADDTFARTGPPLEFPPVDPVEEALFAVEAAVVHDLELTRARQQLAALSERLSALETSRVLRAEAHARRAVRGIRRRRKRSS
jgi:hypothetical protein